MTSIQSFNSENQNPISANTSEIIDQNVREKFHQPLFQKNLKTTWIERLKSYFITNDGRISLVELFFTLICVVLQHVMGTCQHYVSDGTTVIQWHVFTPPFGAGPHTAVFFFVLSWTTLAYCIEHLWIYLTTGARVSKKRNLIIHGIIVILFFTALGFNIWGYVLCESSSQVATSKSFVPGVCRGDSQTCIPLIAGILSSCATACAFFSEHILALTNCNTVLRGYQDPNESTPTRILP